MHTMRLRTHSATLITLAALQLALDLTPAGAQAARAELPRYSVQLLPSVPTYGDLRRVEQPVALNNKGVVGGVTQLWSGSDVELHATLWSPAGPRLLNGSTGLMSQVRGINDSGTAVGHIFSRGGGPATAMRWNADGSELDLGHASGASFSDAAAINQRGQVAGMANLSIAGNAPYVPVLWGADASVAIIGNLPRAGAAQAASDVRDLNDNGTVLGVTQYDGSPIDSPWRWNATGGFTTLQKFSATSMDRPVALNNGGWAVGTAWETTGTNDLPQAVLWNPQGQQLALQGHDYFLSIPRDINGAGLVVGTGERNGGSRAWIWSAETGMVDLNTLVADRPGFEISSAEAINDLGQITGWGYDHLTGQGGVFVLTPVPEPAPAALLAAGLLALAWRRRGRGRGRA